MKLSAIVAMTPEGVIGRNGRLPWHLPSDLKYFREITTRAGIVIMGRVTYESILARNNGPLLGREMIVISRGKVPNSRASENVSVVASFDDAITMVNEVHGGKQAFVIGGAQIYAVALPHIETICITLVHGVKAQPGDVYFPRLPDVDWRVVEQSLENRFQGDEYTTSRMLLKRRIHEEWPD